MVQKTLTAQTPRRKRESNTHLELELGASEVGAVLLPEVVRLDDEGHVDAGGERLLQDLQNRLDAIPLGAAHVHDDREAMSGHILAGGTVGKKRALAKAYCNSDPDK